MDPDILEKYQVQIDPYSTGSSSSHPGRIGGDTMSKSKLQGSIWITDWYFRSESFSWVLFLWYFESLYSSLVESESVVEKRKISWRSEQEEPASDFQGCHVTISLSCIIPDTMPHHHQYGCLFEALFIFKPSGVFSCITDHHMKRYWIAKEEDSSQSNS